MACSDETKNPAPSAPEPPYSFLSYSVLPQTTDPNISTGLSTQYAYLPQEASLRKNRLFIFLPGTFAKPQTYLRITQTAAEYGYHAIGIHYQNSQDIGSYCGSTNDETCDSLVLQEFFSGEDTSPLVTVGLANGFQNRIKKMLLYLDAQNPGENWQQFLDANQQIRWNLVSLAGHSQGSGHTLFISKKVRLLRAGLFSGPNGFLLSNGQYPSWVIDAGATPEAQVYGFSNQEDDLSQWVFVSNVWQQIGLEGPEVNVDISTDFGNSHQLTTEVIPPPTPGSASPTHGSTTVDIVIPLAANGRPRFEPVWRYMCFPD
ncbi:MAG: hypothetical protein OHK0053_14400 [Microscillaceae bacterium]